MSLIHKLRCKLSEPYRIKNGFGLSPIRNKREMEALIKFCKIQRDEIWESSFSGIWLQTIRMHEQAKQADLIGEPHNRWNKLNQYIIDHCGAYWS